MPQQLKVLTYNVMKLGSPLGPENIVSEVVSLDADILLLQEVFNTNFSPADFENAKHHFESILPQHGYGCDWSPSSGPGPLVFGKFRDGLMVAFRQDRWQPVADVLTRSLGGVFGRRIVQCRLLSGSLDNHPFTLAICNTHLSFGNTEKKREKRKKQIGRVQEFLAETVFPLAPDHLILGGDLNSPGPTNGGPSSEEYQLVVTGGTTGVGFEDTWTAAHASNDAGVTFDLGNSNVGNTPWEASVRIDYLLQHRPAVETVGTGLVPRESRVVLDSPVSGHHPSDHFGVLTIFELAP